MLDVWKESKAEHSAHILTLVQVTLRCYKCESKTIVPVVIPFLFPTLFELYYRAISCISRSSTFLQDDTRDFFLWWSYYVYPLTEINGTFYFLNYLSTSLVFLFHFDTTDASFNDLLIRKISVKKNWEFVEKCPHRLDVFVWCCKKKPSFFLLNLVFSIMHICYFLSMRWILPIFFWVFSEEMCSKWNRNINEVEK